MRSDTRSDMQSDMWINTRGGSKNWIKKEILFLITKKFITFLLKSLIYTNKHTLDKK